MAAQCRERIEERELTGLEYLDRISSLLELLRYTRRVAGAGRSETQEAPVNEVVALHRGFTPVGRSSPGHTSQSSGKAESPVS